MMRNMGYNLNEPDGFHNGRGIQVPLEPYMTKRQKEDWLEDRRLDLSPHGLGYLPLDLPSPKKYEEETDLESSDAESWDSNSCIPDLFPLAVNCTTAKPETFFFLHSCGRWRELASYLGPAMLAHLYMGLSELVMRGSEEKKNGKKE